MIESLTGKIVKIENNELVLQIGPINLLILVPASEKYLELNEGKELTIKTILDVKEDSLNLIGFLDENERKLFQKLISVKGVGSKVAITILSSITIGDIIESVSSNNHNIIKQVPGIGDKTAKLILIQLQGQLDNISMKNTSVDLDVQLEATKAVEALGYQNEEIRKIINSLNNSNLQNLDTESLIRIIIEKISLQNQS
ncbi:MAG: Holliday junction branch migration protein RuvA [Chloroflexi bacterium]|nr:Holliday junction branch migration protein RuvA [Chloroflexota bacterium]|tara:strand:+ start:197 stop:793 length:597 start_codon:yes stop_codon:yes gene_type:complete